MHLILYGLLLYLIVLASMYLLQRKQIYFPDKRMPNLERAGVSDMSVITVQTGDGLILQGWYKAPSDTNKPVLVMFHGNAGNIEMRAFKARFFIDAGYGILLAEYRGYGGNKGKPTEQNFYKDARAYMEWLKKNYDGGLILHGESLGTGVASQMALENEGAQALILEMPYTDFRSLAQQHMPFLPAYYLIKDRYDNITKLPQLDMPVQILHGTADMIVPYSHAQKLLAAGDGNVILDSFPAGGHNNLYNMGAAHRIVTFLEALE